MERHGAAIMSTTANFSCCGAGMLAGANGMERRLMRASAEVTLYPHQEEALAWMVARENSNQLPPFWGARRLRRFWLRPCARLQAKSMNVLVT